MDTASATETTRESTSATTSPTRVTVAQLAPAVGDVDANRETIESTLAHAQDTESDLVVFPELFLTGYHIGDDLEALTESASEALDSIRSLTDDLVAVVGAPVSEEGEIYNSAVVLQDGSIEGAYHKTHLWGDEPTTFTSGTRFPTFDTAVGTLGIEICYDLEFPEVARQLTLNGADLLITISANMRPCDPDQKLYHGTRALENGRPHVLCNRVGTERGVDFFGNSGIVNYRGQRILSLGADLSDVASASIPTDPDRTHSHDYIGDRRAAIYDL